MCFGISLPQIPPPFNVCFGAGERGLAAEQKKQEKI